MRKILEIPLLNGASWKVEAEIIGDLAVHEQFGSPEDWSVTHVPTLMTLKAAAPPALLKGGNGAGLCRWAETVQKSRVKEWAALRKLKASDVATQPEKSKKLRGIIRDHCQSMKS